MRIGPALFRTRRLLPLLALITLVHPDLAGQRKLKVHISVDMEGIAGVVSPEQLGPSGFEYQRAREFMTGRRWRRSRAPGPPGQPRSWWRTPMAMARTC